MAGEWKTNCSLSFNSPICQHLLQLHIIHIVNQVVTLLYTLQVLSKSLVRCRHTKFGRLWCYVVPCSYLCWVWWFGRSSCEVGRFVGTIWEVWRFGFSIWKVWWFWVLKLRGLVNWVLQLRGLVSCHLGCPSAHSQVKRLRDFSQVRAFCARLLLAHLRTCGSARRAPGGALMQDTIELLMNWIWWKNCTWLHVFRVELNKTPNTCTACLTELKIISALSYVWD